MKRKAFKYKRYADEDLVEVLVKNSDKRALEELYLRYGHLVFGLCMKYLKHRENAEDLTSQLFIKLPEKLQGSTIQSFKSWLYTVTKNECLMLLRKKTINTVEANEERIYSENDGLHEKLNQELKYEELENAIDSLSEEQSIVIKAFYLKKQSYKLISEKYNLPIKKVKSAIQNGKRNLRIILEEHDLFKSA